MDKFVHPMPHVGMLHSNESGRDSSRGSTRVARLSQKPGVKEELPHVNAKEELKLPNPDSELLFENSRGGVSTRRNQKLALKQNTSYINQIEHAGSFSGLNDPALRLPRTDDRLQEAQPTVGYSISRNSRNSGMSKGEQSMINPSSSASRSRPSEQPYGAEKDNISIKFQNSNHDEPSNYEPAAQNPEMFAPGSGYPHSKKSGNQSKFKKVNSLTVVAPEIKNLPQP